jgi:hypothetical protein
MHLETTKIKHHFKARKKELIFSNCVPLHPAASPFINENNAARLEMLPMCLRKSHESSEQYMSRVLHSTPKGLTYIFSHSQNTSLKIPYKIDFILTNARSTLNHHLESTSFNMTVPACIVCIPIIKHFCINNCKIKAILCRRLVSCSTD